MTIDNYNEYRTYHSQLMELVFLYFKDVICKEDINEDLVFRDVWFQSDRVIILCQLHLPEGRCLCKNF
jgi:hypothetical protein